MRSICLDVSRCLAVVLLLLAHIGQTIVPPMRTFFFSILGLYTVSIGGLAVTIFLIISGAALELQYGGKDIRYSSFIAKRCWRIYPVYYLSLLLSIIIYAIRSCSEKGDLLAGFSGLGIKDLVLSITGGYAFWGEWGGPFLATSWFIALIMTMYLLFPLLSRLIAKYRNVSIGLLFFISVVSRIIVGRYEILPTSPLEWFPLCRVFEFSLGIYLSSFLSKLSFGYVESSRQLRSLTAFLSKLSFPLFLIHYPLLIVIGWLTERGVNQWAAICTYLLISLALSWIVLSIDDRLPKPFVSERVICKPRISYV